MSEPMTKSGRALRIQAGTTPNPRRLADRALAIIEEQGKVYLIGEHDLDTVRREARAALLDELEAAVRAQERHEGSLAGRTDIQFAISLDAESRVSAYRHVLFLIQQHREEGT